MSHKEPTVAATIKGLRDSNETLRRLTGRHLPLLDDAATLLESLSARVTQAETETAQAKRDAWAEGERHESEYLNMFGQFCPLDDCNPYPSPRRARIGIEDVN